MKKFNKSFLSYEDVELPKINNDKNKTEIDNVYIINDSQTILETHNNQINTNSLFLDIDYKNNKNIQIQKFIILIYIINIVSCILFPLINKRWMLFEISSISLIIFGIYGLYILPKSIKATLLNFLFVISIIIWFFISLMI